MTFQLFGIFFTRTVRTNRSCNQTWRKSLFCVVVVVVVCLIVTLTIWMEKIKWKRFRSLIKKLKNKFNERTKVQIDTAFCARSTERWRSSLASVSFSPIALKPSTLHSYKQTNQNQHKQRESVFEKSQQETEWGPCLIGSCCDDVCSTFFSQNRSS
jgi:hypothetical protein